MPQKRAVAKRSVEKLKGGSGAVDPYIHIWDACFSNVIELILALSPTTLPYRLRIVQEKWTRTEREGRIDRLSQGKLIVRIFFLFSFLFVGNNTQLDAETLQIEDGDIDISGLGNLAFFCLHLGVLPYRLSFFHSKLCSLALSAGSFRRHKLEGKGFFVAALAYLVL